jgi:hypothetical protein
MLLSYTKIVRKAIIIIVPFLVFLIVFFLVSQNKKVPANGKFGFLRNASDINQEKIEETGASWLRPNFGDFVWGEMQKDKDAPIDFSATDNVVKSAKKHGLNLLVTLFPYADWDQKGDEKCRVSADDEMLPRVKGSFKTPGLPYYRCNPHDWALYEKWLTAVVKRYGGDISYYEVGNEPDLTKNPNGPGMVFYLGTPENYTELLQKSYTTIKSANSNVQVLIAGAAGVQPEFQTFWRKVFSASDIANYFDIANIHCISSPGGDQNNPLAASANDLNVSSYNKLLSGYQISKPVWVTEAENIQGGDVKKNVKRLNESVANALHNGAQKIFFTGASFTNDPMKYTSEILIKEKSYYKAIISSY